MGHPQPKTPIHCDNATTVGIANNSIKRQRSRSMEMRHFWVADKVAQNIFSFHWHPGQENMADYQSKHHTGVHHQAVRPWYLHTHDSPMVLPRALKPSTLKGCVGILPQGYARNVPLPRIPRNQSTSLKLLTPILGTGYQVPTYPNIRREDRSTIATTCR